MTTYHHSIKDSSTPWMPEQPLQTNSDNQDTPPADIGALYNAVFDRAGGLTAINRRWSPPPGDLPARLAALNTGDPWPDLERLGADVTILREGLASVLAGDSGHFEHNFSMRRGTIAPHWFRCVIAPLVAPDSGRPAGATLVLTDVSRELRAEQRARHVERHFSELATHLSHELRTPLNAVIGFSEMMIRQSWGCLGHQRYAAYAQDIHNSGKHLLALVNQILDFAKIEAGKQTLADELADLADLAGRAAKLVADMAERSGLSLVLDLDDTLPTLRLDRRMIAQVLINLLSNAVKFTPAGGTITVSSGIDADGHPFAAVTDTGIGIDPDHFDRVLEPFGQLHQAQPHPDLGQGTGLGLPLCKRFLELHDGTLHLSSQPGQGTTVTARFPRSRMVARPVR